MPTSAETTCQHTFDVPYTHHTTAGGETGMECSKCGVTNVQVGLAEHVTVAETQRLKATDTGGEKHG